MALQDKGAFLVDDSKWKTIKKNLSKGNQLAIKLGWFEESRYGPENDNLPVAQIAMQNNEGVGIPMRPFFYYYMLQLEKENKLVPEMSWAIHQVAIGSITWTRFYEMLGEEAKQDLKKVIDDWNIPPNAPFTIQQKGKDDPLVDTGLMRDSVDYKMGRKTE